MTEWRITGKLQVGELDFVELEEERIAHDQARKEVLPRCGTDLCLPPRAFLSFAGWSVVQQKTFCSRQMTFFAHGWKLLLSNNNLFIHYIIFCSCRTCSCSPFVHQATFHSLHDLLSSPDNLSFTSNGRHAKSRSRSRRMPPSHARLGTNAPVSAL